MAEVYVAKTKGIGGFEKLVAIKLIHPRFSEDEHFVNMLVEEAKLSVLLNHTNIGQTFDLGCIDNTYCIVMEFISGADAYRILRRAAERERDLDIDQCVYIAREVCAGLSYAHQKSAPNGEPLNIVHRDISPQNVIVSFSGEVKIVDFGIAKAALRTAQTEVGVIKGKYYYMSPEQAWADPVDARSDVFSAGVVLYELLTGEMLYQEENLPKLLDLVRKAEIAPPSRKRREIPKALERIVMKALKKRPEDRYQNADAFGLACAEFLYSYNPSFAMSRVASTMLDLFAAEAADAASIIPVAADSAQQDLMTAQDYHPHESVIYDLSDAVVTDNGATEGPTKEQRSPTVVTSRPRGRAKDELTKPALLAANLPPPMPGRMPALLANDSTEHPQVYTSDDDPTTVSPSEWSPQQQGDWEDPTTVEPLPSSVPGDLVPTDPLPTAPTQVMAPPVVNIPRPPIPPKRALRKSSVPPMSAGVRRATGKMKAARKPILSASAVPPRPTPSSSERAPTTAPIPVAGNRSPALSPSPAPAPIPSLPPTPSPPQKSNVVLTPSLAPPAPSLGEPAPHLSFGLDMKVDSPVKSQRGILTEKYQAMEMEVGRRFQFTKLHMLLAGAAIFVLCLPCLVGWLFFRDTGATVRVRSVPPGAEVFVDGNPQGIRTPVDELKLEPGDHLLSLQLDGHLAWEENLHADSGEPIPDRLAILVSEPKIVVVTSPSGAQISVDGVVLGASPVTISQKKLGQHLNVAARLSGHDSVEQRVTVSAGKQELSLRLTALKVVEPAKKVTTMKRKRRRRRVKKKKRRRIRRR